VELARHDAHYVEVLCRDGTLAFPRVEAALKANGVSLLVDASAQLHLKNAKVRSNYLFYLEDVTPEEVGRILEQLGHEDKPDPKKGPGPFAVGDANLVVLRLAPEHRKKLTQFLGVDPLSTSKPGSDEKKDLPGSSASKLARRQALAMAYNLMPPRSPSAEVKRFLDGRQPPRPGTLRVLLILRGKA
jgi:hypothetical protein